MATDKSPVGGLSSSDEGMALAGSRPLEEPMGRKDERVAAAGVLPTDWSEAPEASETHISVVLFVGDRALKLMKPVRTGFLNHTTRRSRIAAAETEVALNRRIAPDVYLGVAYLGAPGGPPEPVVAMRRMPAERRLSDLLGTPEAPDLVREVARSVARFHAEANRSPSIDAAGSPRALRALWDDNLSELRAVSGGIVPRAEIAELEALAGEYLGGRAPLLRARRAADRIVDGHGDLRAEDIFCLPDGPRILDCLAFSERLRDGDVMLDMAFLAMDLERLGTPDLAHALWEEYARQTGDDLPRSLRHHYIAYRASVRAKVACYQVSQRGREARSRAQALSSLARAHLSAGRVLLILVGGAPGSGKSTLARGISEELSAPVLSSDEVRKRLADLPVAPLEQPPALREGIYSQSHTETVYEQLCEDATKHLVRGESVILDATWGLEHLRERARYAARDAASPVIEIECTAPSDLLAERVASPREGPSDATLEVARRLLAERDRWPAARAVDTSGAIDHARRSALAEIDGARRRPFAVRASEQLRG